MRTLAFALLTVKLACQTYLPNTGYAEGGNALDLTGDGITIIQPSTSYFVTSGHVENTPAATQPRVGFNFRFFGWQMSWLWTLPFFTQSPFYLADGPIFTVIGAGQQLIPLPPVFTGNEDHLLVPTFDHVLWLQPFNPVPYQYEGTLAIPNNPNFVGTQICAQTYHFWYQSPGISRVFFSRATMYTIQP